MSSWNKASKTAATPRLHMHSATTIGAPWTWPPQYKHLQGCRGRERVFSLFTNTEVCSNSENRAAPLRLHRYRSGNVRLCLWVAAVNGDMFRRLSEEAEGSWREGWLAGRAEEQCRLVLMWRSAQLRCRPWRPSQWRWRRRPSAGPDPGCTCLLCAWFAAKSEVKAYLFLK